MEKVTHEGILHIDDKDIPCYVTEKGQRLLASRRLQVVLKVTEETTSSGRQVPGKRMDRFFNQKTLKPLLNRIPDRTYFEPVKVIHKGKTIVGYDAKLLPEICRIMLEGRREGVHYGKRQKIIVEQCEILQSGFATIGIIALVDEATGYQEVRDRVALQKILEEFIASELRPWVKTFPNEYYKELFRLRNWQYNPVSVKRPQLVGKITNDVIYQRLAPGVLDELKRITPKDESGRRRHKYFQRLTENSGYKKLIETISNVTTLMKASSNYRNFERLINRAMTKYGHTIEIPFDYGDEDEQLEK